MYRNFLKRLIDFFIVLSALLIIWPILLIIIIFLHFANKGAGVFFTQARPGKNAQIFKAIKFKTMTDERDAEGNLLPDDVRLTKVGKIVRSLSIDELPQLINVLKGDMALVGPRPLLIKYLPLLVLGLFCRNICLFTQKSKREGMRFVRGLQVGHNAMGAMRSAGRRSLSWMFGMWIISLSGWI